MEYEWDEAKRVANLRKHGIDFTDVLTVFDSDIVTVEDGSIQVWRAAFCYIRFVARASYCCCPCRA
jgi:uncharacterized DUF497 family protein